MNKIGGKTVLNLKYKDGYIVNSIGEKNENWANLMRIKGYLDLSSGSSYYQNYNAKLQESSHIFVCDYVSINKKATELRAEINGKEYDVLYIDNPMELNQHLEIYLDYIGD